MPESVQIEPRPSRRIHEGVSDVEDETCHVSGVQARLDRDPDLVWIQSYACTNRTTYAVRSTDIQPMGATKLM